VTHALALPISGALALALVPPALRQLRALGATRPNYRGARLPWPAGILIVLVALLSLLALGPLAQLDRGEVFYPHTAAVALYVVGVALLGLLDDLLGPRLAGGPRGVLEHARALRGGQVSTGVLKGLGSGGLALYCASALGLADGGWLLASAVLVLATHAFNLLDLRPGRAAKSLVLLGAGLTVAAGPRAAWTLGAFLGPALVLGAWDLRERALLGDCGAGALGALAGWWLVLTLSSAGLAVALALLAAVCVYGELRSISLAVERLPLLRRLDSLGRPPR
jgi:UDP-N-acetylmuramyl pentapeptide phosphotransferase/UDP-N-acetylglucosamine-1-phosphate transferase